MADGSLIFDTSLDPKGFQDGVSSLGNIANKAFSAVTTVVVATAAAIATMGVAATKVGMNFEAGMSQVAATMGISAQSIRDGDSSFQALEKAAKDAGATTQFSATQASEALNYLALAGYDADKSIQALPKVLNLAAAGGLELGYASDLVTDSMSALGLETEELGSFVDELAKASQKSNTNISQLGEAILTVGGTAKILAGGTVELSTQLGILADNGIKGSEGGTALRNVLLSLSAPTDKQTKALNKLNLETYDANGNLRSTNDIFEDLNGKLSSMTQEEKTKVLSDLFNKVDLKAANALLANSGDRFKELSEQIANSEGAAAQMAETLNDNLKGKIEILKSGLEGLGISIYQGMDTPLKGVVETITGYVDKIAGVLTAHDDIKASAEKLGMTAEELGFDLSKIPNGFEDAVEVMGSILADMVMKVAEAAPKLLELAVTMIMSFIQGIKSNQEGIVSAALDIVNSFIVAILTILPELVVVGIEIITSLIQGVAGMMPSLIPLAVDAITTILDSLSANVPLILQAGIEILLALINGIVEIMPSLVPVAVNAIMTIVSSLVSNLPTIIQAGIEILLALINGLIEIIPELIPVAVDAIITIVEALIANIDLLIDAAIAIIFALAEGLINSLPTLIEKAPEIINSLVDAIIRNAGPLARAALELIIVLGKGLIQSIPTLLKNIPQIVDAALNAFTIGFYAAKEVGKAVVEGIWEGIKSAKDWLLSKLKEWAGSIMNGLKSFFGIKSPSTLTRDLIGKNLALGVGVGIEEEMPELSRDIDREMAKLTNRMKATVELETNKAGTVITADKSSGTSKDIVNNNDNGITQHLTIVSPENTPSENARQIKKAGRELLFGY